MRRYCSNLRLVALLLAIAPTAVPAMAQAGANSDTTTLTAAHSSITVGAEVQLSAAVGGTGGGPTATGTVQFLAGATVLATETLANGTATLTTPTTGIPPGAYSLKAKYSGDAYYAPSVSAPVTETITPFETATALTITPSPVDEGSEAHLTATVAQTGSSGMPTGSVTFSVNGTPVATATLSHGTAKFTASSAGIAAGSYAVTAKYSGDTDNAKSTSAPVSVRVVGTTTTTLAFARGTYAVGQVAQMTATVSAPSGGAPTGTVKFSVGRTVFGSAALVGGVATLQGSTAGFAAGTYTVTATYSGNSQFEPSSGSAVEILQPGYTVLPGNAALIPSGTTQFTLSPAPTTGTVTWYVEGVPGGNSVFGTIDANGNYTAPTVSLASLKAAITASLSTEPDYITPPAYAFVDVPGTVASTANTQVAAYTINIPDGASASINFGTTTAYGLNTWSLPAPDGGGSVTILVAGMLAQTEYHMQAVVSLPGGLTFTDADKTYTTGAATGETSVTTVTTGTPQPGLEMLDRFTPPGAYVYDLAGNLLWAYTSPTAVVNSGIQPFKPLSDGNFLINLSPDSSYAIDGSVLNPNTPIDIREVDLTNKTIRDLDLATLQNSLNNFGYVNSLGEQISLLNMHHDVTVNPTTGHWMVISNTEQVFDDLTGFSSPETVLGDVIVDVDPANNFAVDWVWNEFDHLDVNRHPMDFPDWTHTNAIVYSKDDGNILVSIRHQNWIIKVNYKDGTGDGTILWKLGYQGDFTLIGGTSPIDWQYAQHGPSFTTANTTGVFGLAVMDNGNDRVLGSSPCPIVASPCLYSRAPIFTVDETAMTATLSNGAVGPGYSNYGGNANILPNGDLEADYCAIGTYAVIQETTLGDSPQVIWQATTTGTDNYRSYRVGSFYPGITWSADAIKFQVDHAVHVK